MKPRKQQIKWLENKVERLEENPGGYAEKKLETIDHSLDRIFPRPSNEPENKSMYEHLIELQEKWENKPEEMVKKEIQKTEAEINRLKE